MNFNNININKKNIIYYIAGGTGISLLIGGIIYLWKKAGKTSLNPWLEDYFTEVQKMLTDNKDNEPTVEIIGHIFQLITEVEEYLYLLENADIEEARLQHVNKEKEYRLLFSETIQIRNDYYEKASAMVEKRLGVSISQIEQGLGKFNSPEEKLQLRNAKKKYVDVPNVEKKVVREAFVFFVNQKRRNDQIAQDQYQLVNMNPEYRTKAMATIYLAKNKLKDEIKAKYKFDEKYFEQLLEKHTLLQDDDEIKTLYEEFKFGEF